MQDRIPGAPGQYLFKISADEIQKLMNAEECVVVLKRDDQPVVEGTPLSKATFLPDDLAAELCPEVEDPTPADALRNLNRKSSMNLLWENASPGSSFAPQTISLDLSGYDICEIFYRGVLTDSGYETRRVPIGYSTWMYIEWNARYVRKATVMTTGVEFGAGYGADFASTTMQPDSTAGVPLAIYGIKGVY